MAYAIVLSNGKLAKQAGASLLCTAGETKVLVLVTMTREPKEDIDFSL